MSDQDIRELADEAEEFDLNAGRGAPSAPRAQLTTGRMSKSHAALLMICGPVTASLCSAREPSGIGLGRESGPRSQTNDRRLPDDPPARGGGWLQAEARPPRVPRNRHHGLSRGRRHAGERPGHGRTREPAHDQLYDRTSDAITLDEVERITI